MTSLILPAHIAAERAPVAQLSERDLGASGNRLLGEFHMNETWIGFCNDILRRSMDPAEKRVARMLIEEFGLPVAGKLKAQLANVSRLNHAIELFKPNDRDIRQDVLQGEFTLE